MMNFPGVLSGEPEVLQKVADARLRSLPVDGHAPGLTGQQLVAYAAVGIRSDHESTTAEEALAKAALGMLVQVREGSSTAIWTPSCHSWLRTDWVTGVWSPTTFMSTT